MLVLGFTAWTILGASSWGLSPETQKDTSGWLAQSDRSAPASPSRAAPSARTPSSSKALPPTSVPSAGQAPRAVAQNQAPNGPGRSEAQPDLNVSERAKRAKFSFDFSKAEIVDIVRAISDMTRRNFIIPDNLKSQRLTILSPNKITSSEAYRVFLSALAANDITVVRVGRFYKLVRSKDAIKQPIPTCVSPEEDCPSYTDVMVTELVPLKHVDAQQLSGVVKPLISKEGEIAIFAPTNSLIISEYATNLTRVQRIITALDQPGFDDELQIVQIRYRTSGEIAEMLTQIYDVQARPRNVRTPRGRTGSAGRRNVPDGRDDESEVQISKIISDEGTNQVIIKANRRSFPAIKQLIDRLDVPMDEEEQGSVHVYYLENADAEELASTLSSLAQGSPSNARSGRPQRPQRGESMGPSSAELFEGDVKVTADKSNNALIIMASRHDFRALKTIIDKLDVARRQVYIEAAILEVSTTGEDNYGVDWHAPYRLGTSDIGNQAGPAIGFVQSAQGGAQSSTLAAFQNPAALINSLGGSVIGLFGDGVDIDIGDGESVTVPSFGVLLRWIETSTQANILSTPHILTTDNEEASIEVGERRPFQRGTAIPAGFSGATGDANNLGNLGNLFSSTDRIDVSLKLNLKPQINERNKIKLEIEQSIEDIAGTEPLTQQPITSTRSAKTVVVIDDQQSVVLGGLIRDKTEERESKIPILGDIPLLGYLFKQRGKVVNKVNLLLVLTPYIIRDTEDFQEIYKRKMREYEEFAADYYGSTPEYRAHIDYRRKTGPLGLLGQTIRRESEKLENGGSGDGSELLIGPDKQAPEAPAAEPSDAAPEGSMTPESGGLSSEPVPEGGN